MVRWFGRQKFEVCAIHSNTVEVVEIRVARLTPGTHKVQGAVRLIDPKQLQDGPVTGRDLVFKVTSFQVIQVEMSPIISLGKPDRFICFG